MEEDFLKQRAKLHWLDVGDQNNKTFHNAIRSRQAQNTIREIRCQNGITVTQQQDIKEESVRFFSEFLNQTPEDYSGASIEELRELLEFRCSAGIAVYWKLRLLGRRYARFDLQCHQIRHLARIDFQVNFSRQPGLLLLRTSSLLSNQFSGMDFYLRG